MSDGGLRVATWNVHGLRGDHAALATVLRAVAPDVLTLTEPPRGPRGRARLAHWAGEYGLRVAARVRTCAVLVRADLPSTGERTVRLPWTPGLTRRGVAIAEVAGVRVIAVHLGLRATERARHVAEIVRLVEAAPGACVVAGDLNEQPTGSSWRVLGRVVSDLAPGSGATYPATDPSMRIDAVLGRGVQAGRAVTTPPEGSAARASDHLPVLAEVHRIHR